MSEGKRVVLQMCGCADSGLDSAQLTSAIYKLEMILASFHVLSVDTAALPF